MKGSWVVGMGWLLIACGTSTEDRVGGRADAGDAAADASAPDAQPAASCVDSTESGVITLSPDLADLHFTDHRVAPDSERVVMLAAIGDPGDGVQRMFSSPVCGGEATEIGPPTGSGAVFLRVKITPDSSRVVFSRNAGLEIDSVPIAGGDITPLAPLPGDDPDYRVGDFVVGPDGTVVYLTHTDQGIGRRLFSVPADGSREPELLAEPTNVDGEIYPTFELTATGDRVVFAADLSNAGIIRLYSVPTAGGDLTPLTPTAADAPGASRFFHVSGDDVLFTGSLDGPVPNRLYSTAATGGSPTVLGTLDGVFLYMHDVPSSDDVVFVGVRGDGVRRVYRATIGTPGVALVSGDGGNQVIGVGEYEWSLQLNADSSRIVFMDDRDTAYADALYSAPISGGEVRLISQPNSDSTRGIGLFTAIPGSDQVVYSSTIEQGISRLYRVADTGGDIVELAPEDEGSTCGVTYGQPSADGAWLVCKRVCTSPSTGELFKIRPDGSDRTDVFNEPSGATVWDFDLSPDNRWIVWNAMVDGDGRVRVFARRL
jgi:hypothetical protein